MKIFLAERSEMEGKRIDEVMGREFLDSPFWMYWRTMFAFEDVDSALEFKLYLHRFIHHIGGLPDFTALKFTKYNQYESFVLPLMHYLTGHGVVFRSGTRSSMWTSPTAAARSAPPRSAAAATAPRRSSTRRARPRAHDDRLARGQLR